VAKRCEIRPSIDVKTFQKNNKKRLKTFETLIKKVSFNLIVQLLA